MILVAILLAGCGGGSDHPAPATTSLPPIPSSYSGDGEVFFDGANYTLFTSTTTPPRGAYLSVGVPTSGGEYVAILDFPLGTLPTGVTIARADLDLSYLNLDPAALLSVELVDVDAGVGHPITFYSGAALWPSDASGLPTLLSVQRTVPTTTALGARILLDVTSLLDFAQVNNFSRFQVRIALAGSSALAHVTIDDPASGSGLFPYLDVDYF
jgi:hypothetical protein